MADVNLDLNETSIEDMLNGFSGPVADVVLELAAQAEEVAKRTAPHQSPRTWSWSFAKSTSYEPRSFNYLQSSISLHGPAYNKNGQLYGGVNSALGPTLFLERQHRWPHVHRLYPFMSGALDSVHL